MKHTPFLQRVVADIVFSERQPGRDDGRDIVQWQMPVAVMDLFHAEARRQGVDLNTLIRDVICAALTERVEAIRHANAELDRYSID
jgi:hypothetical protein